jgi:indole-3-glycerol phosphate synthase
MSVLDRIFETKREEVAEAKVRAPLSVVMSLAAEASPPRGFRAALASSERRPALIAEVKKASPSQGVIREDFDPAEVARSYERVGAQALSVLTDSHYFQGSLQNLVKAREAVALPALRKDFICDPYQIYEARAYGADAVLLIAASLAEGELTDLQASAKELGMDVLVEVHSIEEAEVALRVGADLVGINNRNLADFSTDLAITESVAPLLRGRALIVSESALGSLADIGRVARAGAAAVLIGTAFCAAADIEGKVREVMGW